jgi:tetratricopeptide (TPR) repeat protein
MAKDLEVIDGGRGAGCGFLTDTEIDAYFSRDLDSERNEAFSAHRAEGCRPCSLFGADMRVYRDLLDNGVLDSERKNFAALADGQRAELKRALQSARAPRRTVFPNWLLSAAAMIAIAGFISFQLLEPSDIHPAVTLPGGESFTFEVPAAPPLVRDGGDFARGRSAFADGDYAKAVVAFERISNTDPMYPDAQFFAGVSHLVDHNDASAVERLTVARELAIADGLAGDEAAYYLSLARIELGDHEQARNLLKSIAAGSRSAEAAKLLELLGP